MKIQGLTEENKRNQIAGEIDPSYSNINFANVNMFVEAGAGAGKTTLIVQRIVNQLKQGDAPGSFVVITFTNAAAEELRGRIFDKVKKEGLKDALTHLDEMNISTIHSFCNVLLKEQSLAAGLPQDLELIEPIDNKKLQKQFFDEYLMRLTAKDWDALEQHSLKNSSRWMIKKDLEELFYLIADLPEDTKICTPRDLQTSETILSNRYQIVKDILSEILSSAQNLLDPNAKNPVAPYHQLADLLADEKLPSSKTINILEVACNSLLSVDEQTDEILRLIVKSTPGKYFKASGLTKAYKKEDVKSEEGNLTAYIENEIGVLRQLVPSNVDKERAFVEQLQEVFTKELHYRTLLEYAKQAKKYYKENRPKNKISNDNLLEFTRDLVCNEEDRRALAFYANKYKHYYIDEFQDTDRIQESFIYRLASEVDYPGQLRDGALFVVGDPKQSIYRFRGAQPEIYFDVKSRMADANMANAYVYELENNFRSNSQVIDWINDKFNDSDPITPIVSSKHPYQAMQSVKGIVQMDKDADKLISGVYSYEKSDATVMGLVAEKDRKTGDYVAKEGLVYVEEESKNDIQDVVDLILNLKNNGYMITKYDDNHEPYAAKITFRDFLLIPQDTTMMVDYLEALKSHGIPVRFDGKANVAGDKILNTYVRLFWYIVNPKEPFHRMAAKEALSVCGLSLEGQELKEYLNAMLDHLYYGCKGMSVFGKTQYLEKQLSALLEKNKAYDVIQTYSIKTRLRQMIEAVLNGETGTGVQLAQAFDDYLASSIEHELSLEEGADAVRFMNLHKSKGLEGEIVIILDRRGHRGGGASAMREGSIFYPAIKNWSSISQIERYAKIKETAEDAEFHRLEYVAATRAKQAIIFMNVISHGGIFASSNNKIVSEKSASLRAGKEESGYNYHINKEQSVKDIIKACQNQIAQASVLKNYDLRLDGYQTVEENNAPDGCKVEDKKKGAKPIFYKVNPSGLENGSSSTKTKSRRDNLQKLTEEELEQLQEFYRRPKGNVLGDTLHRTMELLVNRYDESVNKEEDIKKLSAFCARQAVREFEEEIPGNDSAEEYFEFVRLAAFAYYQWIIETNLCKDVKQIYTEMPFSYVDEKQYAMPGKKSKLASLDNSEKELFEGNNDVPSWVNGTADLILEYKDGSICLIDYKSDNDFLIDETAMEQGFVDIYSPQIQIYREIINKTFGVAEDKIKAGIISFSMKDEAGNKLPDDRLRVRFTQM